MNTEIIDAGRDMSGGYKVDVSRGENVDRVSSEWFSRPDDERYLSLDDLFASAKGRAERSRTRTVESAAIRVEAHLDNPEKLGLVLPGADEPVAPTHWSFGQLSSLIGAPAAYLRQLPAPLAGINLQYGLTNHRAEQIKTMEVADGRTELRAVTGPDYGRIYDHELVSAVQRIAGNGTGDTRWKVPGVLDWSTGIYNPRVDVTKETTTLYASDRDVFLFLVDDFNPIEAGLLWAIGKPISGTLAERYLAKRGLTGLGHLDSLRFHPRCYYWREEHRSGNPPETWPALLAKVTDLDGRLTGLHRTWLNPATADKALVCPPRKAMGNLLGHGVRIGEPNGVLLVGEGLETMISLHLALPRMACVAALSANHLAALKLPKGLYRLYIAVDPDPAGVTAAEQMERHAGCSQIDTIHLSPRLGDFNDDLRATGLDELRAQLRPQLAPEDAAVLLDLAFD